MLEGLEWLNMSKALIKVIYPKLTKCFISPLGVIIQKKKNLLGENWKVISEWIDIL